MTFTRLFIFNLMITGLFTTMETAHANSSLATCLSHETIGVTALEKSATLESTSHTLDHSVSLIAVTQTNLRKFGAGVFTIYSQPSFAVGPAALIEPLEEAFKQEATLLLVISLDAKEFRADLPNVNSDPYPIRTIKLQVTTEVVDVHTRNVLTSLEWPEATYAKNSTDEAVKELLANDFSEKLAETMTQACEGRTQPTTASQIIFPKSRGSKPKVKNKFAQQDNLKKPQKDFPQTTQKDKVNPATDEEYRNQKRHSDLTDQWTLLSNKLQKLTIYRGIETRPEEAPRLDVLIKETKNQLDQVEKDLKTYEKHH